MKSLLFASCAALAAAATASLAQSNVTVYGTVDEYLNDMRSSSGSRRPVTTSVARSSAHERVRPSPTVRSRATTRT